MTTLTGVAPDSVRQGGYLLKGLEHLRAYGPVAPGAAGRTFGAALKHIDSATRTDYRVGIGRCMGQPFHRILFSWTYRALLRHLAPRGRLCDRRLMRGEC